MQTRRHLLESFVAAALSATVGKASAQAPETIRIGFSAPLSGPFAINGNQMVAALKLFIEQNGTNLAGKKIELIVRDDAGVPDQAKRIAQELVVNSKVAILAGYNFTPVALAVASISAEANSANRHGGGNLNHHRTLALHRAHLRHAGAIVHADGEMGSQKWDQK